MVLRCLPLGASGQYVRTLAPVLGTGLTIVHSAMRGVDDVPGGRPIGVLLLVGEPRVAAGAIAGVAVCLVAAFVGLLAVGAVGVLARAIRLACWAVACVGVRPNVGVAGAIADVAVCLVAAFVGLLAVAIVSVLARAIRPPCWAAVEIGVRPCV